MLGKWQLNSGYISIETIIVVGVMIALGVYAIQKLYGAGEEQTAHALENINQVSNISTSSP